MDNYQKVEQLVNKTGCSFEDAKAALEGCEWDMLDAVIALEREGKIEKAAPQKEEPAEAAEVTADVITFNSAKDSGKNDDNAGKSSAGSANDSEEAPKRKRGIFGRAKRILTKNRMVVLRSNGKTIIDVPIWIPIIALIAFFWATVILAVIAMAIGCRFHFEGEDLGKTNINSTMDKATDYAEKFRNDIAGKTNGEQNTDNRR